MPRPLPRPLLAAATQDATTDAELLRRFTRDGDAVAVELVVRRHAAAVWTACRRILPEADAEDAFQATFLILLRKAGAIRGACAGGWLHRVAVTAALKRKAARHPANWERVPQDSRQPDPLERAELAAVVHEELARLPERYRLPVVLCDLEGEKHTSAAARLGWPVGSVAGRLSRARTLLRDRLARRGFAPVVSVVVLPVAVVPGRVVSAAFAAPTPAITLLVTGVLGAMRVAKLKLVARVVAAAALVGSVGFGAYHAAAQPAPPPREAKGVPPNPSPLPADKLGFDAEPHTAFPEITPPAGKGGLRTALPLLVGVEPPGAEVGGPVYRRLLVARLREGRAFLMRMQIRVEIGSYQTQDMSEVFSTCEDIRAVVSELWEQDSDRLDAWLVELVRYLKMHERLVAARVPNVDPPQALNVATRHRLKMEAALWKHRNPGPRS